MNYTVIPDGWADEVKRREAVSEKISVRDIFAKAKKDVLFFAKHVVGMNLRLYQTWMLDKIVSEKRLAICCARQIGKTTVFAIAALWYVWGNNFSTGIEKTTRIYIMSRDDAAAKDVLLVIRKMIEMADRRVESFSEDSTWMSRQVRAPDNASQITMKGGFIRSMPATDKIIGKSPSIMFGDEAHRWHTDDPDDIFYRAVKPSVAATGGKIILASTPNGRTGFFYDVFDPDDLNERKAGSFERIWFSHEICQVAEYQRIVAEEKEQYRAIGKLRKFEQEYLATFEVVEDQFISPNVISNCQEEYEHEYESDEACCLAIDYGVLQSRTVITIRAKRENKLVQLFQWRSNPDFDMNLLTQEYFEHSIPSLMKRYKNVRWIVPDACPQGDQLNKWMDNQGYPVWKQKNGILGFSFRSDQAMVRTNELARNNAFYRYRSGLSIKPDDPEKRLRITVPSSNVVQLSEMAAVQEQSLERFVRIKASKGMLCDTVDSDVMACLPFLQQHTEFEINIVRYDNKMSEEKVSELKLWSEASKTAQERVSDPRIDQEARRLGL